MRVLLASPGDLGRERSAAQSVVDELNATKRTSERAVSLWVCDTRDHKPTEISRSGKPIGRSWTGPSLDVDQFDLVIGLLSTRWGAASSANFIGREIGRALTKATAVERPQVRLYLCTRPTWGHDTWSLDRAGELESDFDQARLLSRYGTQNELKNLLWADIRRCIRRDLLLEVNEPTSSTGVDLDTVDGTDGAGCSGTDQPVIVAQTVRALGDSMEATAGRTTPLDFSCARAGDPRAGGHRSATPPPTTAHPEQLSPSAANTARSRLASEATRIGAWLGQGRTEATVAHRVGVTVSDVIAFREALQRTQERSSTQRAFVSYVHEDALSVTRIATVLSDAGIPLWRDVHDLVAGSRWRQEIREAIASGSAFIAFFSSASETRETSYMRVELLEAIDQLRRRPRGRPWFIPVRLDACELPDIEIGAGEMLSDLHYIDLFDPPDEEAIAGLIRALQAASTT